MNEKNQLIHVYFVPGLAADTSIFEYIDLPPSRFEIHLLKWFVPSAKLSMTDYAHEMNKKIVHDNPVLIGVSFGGLLVQEMAKYKQIKKTIIISSVKTSNELPKRMYFARYTKAHKLLPVRLVNSVDFLAKYAFGETVKKRLHLYEKYLSIRDPKYLNWAIDQMVNWNQKEAPKDIVHIHGEKDPVFPIDRIKDCIPVKNGTHAMIIYRAKWFNEHLPTIILQ